jgi:hypothetical protein
MEHKNVVVCGRSDRLRWVSRPLKLRFRFALGSLAQEGAVKEASAGSHAALFIMLHTVLNLV